MAGPFKLRSGNSPLFKMMGSSPVKQEKKKVGPVETDPMSRFLDEETTKDKDVQAHDATPAPRDGDGVSRLKKEGKELLPKIDDVKVGLDPTSNLLPVGKTKVKEDKTKTRKRGWFGLHDMGFTEALDAMTKVRKRRKE